MMKTEINQSAFCTSMKCVIVSKTLGFHVDRFLLPGFFFAATQASGRMSGRLYMAIVTSPVSFTVKIDAQNANRQLSSVKQLAKSSCNSFVSTLLRSK
jgi:hypothetical protein